MLSAPQDSDRADACKQPSESVVMYQRWEDLLFLHWKVSKSEIAATLPQGLHVDSFDGSAYLGLVPFFMRKIRPRFFPAVGPISNFLEMNVRTYVYDDSGRPGVWFYSLDANQPLAVRLARGLFHLPYFDASMSADRSTETIHYRCRRIDSEENAESRFSYQGTEELPLPKPGSLEYFLMERYYLFAHKPDSNSLFSGQVHHTPYPAFRADLTEFSSPAIKQSGFDTGGRLPEHVLYSPGVDVKVYPITKVP